ncbi:FapA family protein [bacterium]|nr:FapA family protein [bacterium]MBU1985101.1 FapA family protein [bacterium]
MGEPSSEHRVRLVSKGYNTWKMQVLFTRPDLSASEISERLREVKRELANQFGVPDHLLEYSGLLGRQETRNGLLVQLLITKQDVPANAPRFRTLPLQAPDGTTYSDMRLVADLHPYDEWDHPLTRSVVEARLVAAGFGLSWVDWTVIDQVILNMHETGKPVTELEIARGVLPGTGLSSRLTYGVRRDQDRFLESAWLGVRPVLAGEFIVEASASTSGHQWGRNVYGREIAPRPGQSIRLEAGDGTVLSLRGQQIAARHDGLLVFERYGRDKRQKDAYDLIPVKLVARVLPMKSLAASELGDLVLGEGTAIFGSLPAGTRIRTTSSLYIEGDVERDCHLQCGGSLRITGYLRKATVVSANHVCIHGEVCESNIATALTLHVDDKITDSVVRASDVITGEIVGGDVEALRQPPLHRTDDTGSMAAAIRINLRKFFENRQVAGREALDDLRRTVSQIVDIFGSEIALQASEGTEQRLLLKWIRGQKAAGGGNYTHAEVQEFREVLELIPMIREQLASIGMELRDVTSQLQEMTPDGDST